MFKIWKMRFLKSLLSKCKESSKIHSKKSILKRDSSKEYLMTLTPENLCKELEDSCPQAFKTIASGFLGISDVSKLYQSQQ